jgi:hypothetical protein
LRNGELNQKASKQLKDFKSLYKCTDAKRSCERSCPGHDPHAIKKQKSAGVERPSTTGNINCTALQYYNVSARGQSQSKLIGNERIHKQGGEERCARRGAMMNCNEDFGSKQQQQVQIPSSKASTPRLVRGKVRRYKLLEEVSS